MIMRLSKSAPLLSLIVLLAVTGCKKPSQVPVVGKALDNVSGMKDQTEERLDTAAHAALAEGKKQEALAYYEKLYARNSRNPDTVLNYAQLLRKTGHPDKALDVLEGYLNSFGRRKTPVLLNEYAAAQIEAGHYDEAEDILDKVLKDPESGSYHADADNLLGIALDAQGVHKEAEESYRQALNSWKGDPTSVMNNLGLCLAAQGKFDEALSVLRQALIRAPQKTEIARNIQMVSDLRSSLLPTAPVKVSK